MDEKTKQRLKQMPITKCTICDRPRSHTNPIAKCFECKKKFCFDHIYGGMINNTMDDNEEIRNICFECKDKHNYRDINSPN